MATELQRVQPGDIITSEFLNNVIKFIAALEDRVEALEVVGGGDTSALITQIIPTGPIRVTEELKILGRNFGFSIGAHRVFVDGIRILKFKENSDDEKLIFDMPDIPGLPDEGRAVIVSVSNQTSSDTRTIVVLPMPTPLSGNVDVGFESVTPATIAAGSPANFRYRVKSRANQAAQFLIAATISGVPNQQEWQAEISILDDTGSPINNRTIALRPLQTKFFQVQIATVPANPADATFTLAVNASAPGVTANPDSREFTVGQVTDPEDNTISLSFFSATPPDAFSNGAVRLAEGGIAKISTIAEFHVVGDYDISAAVLTGASWTAERSSATTPATLTINAEDLNNPELTASRGLDFIVRANAGAAATGRVEFRVQRQGITEKRTLKLDLVRL